MIGVASNPVTATLHLVASYDEDGGGRPKVVLACGLRNLLQVFFSNPSSVSCRNCMKTNQFQWEVEQHE